jgi:uncharacterized protein (UPF0332 family)
VKPETKGHLDRADVMLHRARIDVTVLAQEPVKAEDAARNAYYAAFHAAKAFIFERTGTTQKRHGSVHKQFAQLVRTEPSIDPALRTFLPVAYDYKRIGDYDIGPSGKITPAEAVLALKEAERFVAATRALIP